jgi:hypothetical protein
MNDEERSSLPKYIIATRTVTYHVDEIIDSYKDQMGQEPELDDLIDMIRQWAAEDFACGWGHTIDPDVIKFTDSNGEELGYI